MDVRSNSFFELAKSMLDTYIGAVSDVLARKGQLLEPDHQHICEVMNSYLPQMERVFRNLCTTCPVHVDYSERVAEMRDPTPDQAVSHLKDITGFVHALSGKNGPVGTVFVLSLSELSAGYGGLKRSARRASEDWVQARIAACRHPRDAFVHLGSGVFLFHMADLNDPPLAVRKEMILKPVMEFLASGPPLPANGGMPPAPPVPPPPVPRVLETDIENRMAGHFEKLLARLDEPRPPL